MRIKEGTTLRPFGAGSALTGLITKDVADYLIESGKAKESDFESSEPSLTPDEIKAIADAEKIKEQEAEAAKLADQKAEQEAEAEKVVKRKAVRI